MADRIIVIVVSLLLLIVMCGLLLTALVWVPARINQLDNRLGQIEDINARVRVLDDRLANLDKLEKMLGEAALAAAPLTRIDTSVDEISKKMTTTLVPNVNDIKERAVAKSDLDRIAGQITQLDQKIAAAGSKADPEVARLAKEVAELKDLVDAMRKLVDTKTREIATDVKQLHLEMQKLQQRPANP